MPFYEYQCDACAHRLEVLQKISDESLLYCPECGEASLRKLISKAAFRLKGAGWYETDFKNKGAKEDKGGKEEGAEAKEPPPKHEGAKNGASGEAAASGDQASGDKKDGASKKSPASTEAMQKSA